MQRIQEIRIDFSLPVDEKRQVGRYVNVWLVTGRKTCLVDTGPHGGEPVLAAALRARGQSEKTLAWVVNTHEHPDHIGGNAYFKAAADVPFACHEAAVAWIEDHELQCRARPIYAFETLAGEPVRIDRRLREGDVIDLGEDTGLEVLFTPGHSPGSICLYCAREKALLVGDSLQPVGGLPLYEDLGRMRASLEKLLALPDVERMYASCIERPLEGAQIAGALRDSLTYLALVDRLVQRISSGMGSPVDPAELTRLVLAELGFSQPPVMPITIQSIMAHRNTTPHHISRR